MEFTNETLAAIATVVAAIIAAVSGMLTVRRSTKLQKKVAEEAHAIAKNNQVSQEKIASETRAQIERLEPQMENLRHELERSRDFDSFKRHRVHYLLDELNSAYSELNVVIEITARQVWIYGEPNEKDKRFIDIETRFHRQTARIITSLLSLEAFRLIDASAAKEQVNKIKSIWQSKFMAQLCFHVPVISKLFKGREPDDAKIYDAWSDLKEVFNELGDSILSIPHEVSIPSE